MRALGIFVVSCGLAAGCRPAPVAPPAPARTAVAPRLVPEPVSLKLEAGEPFSLTDSAYIAIDSGNAEVLRIAEHFAAIVRPSTGFRMTISTSNAPARHGIVFRLSSDTTLGSEGYRLTVERDSVRVTANAPAGLFHGMQTLRQLMPPEIESHMRIRRSAWTIPAVTIADQPRFSWRGAMLDVSRHFFSVREVKQYIDILALYKLNVLHLHLADDQGWRIEIKSRPNLTAAGSGTVVGGGAGGFFTQEDYSEIVRYASERYVTIVPEIDMPGHVNAALIGYPELSCSRRPPAPYTGTEVGWSTFCANNEETYALVEDVVREIAAITPGQYFHMGGDENPILTKEEYIKFVERAQDIVTRHGKLTVGWEEIVQGRLKPTTIAQAWRTDSTASAALNYGARILLSPAKRTYLDMKYDDATELGLKWAGLVEVRVAYDWDPATYMKGATEQNIIGVEAPLWTETARNITAVQYLAMPRLPALAEVAWTPQASRSWDNFRIRVATHAPRWNLLGINYYRSPQIPW